MKKATRRTKTRKAAKRKSRHSVKIGDLRLRLEEAEQTLHAIRTGKVDALVVLGPRGDQVYTLKGAEQPYRVYVEAMNEGAVTLSLDGTILYCNGRLAELVLRPSEQVIGSSIYRFIAPTDTVDFESAFQRGKQESHTAEISLRKGDGQLVPVYLSFNQLMADEVPAICMVVMDLTERKKTERQLRESEERLRYLSAQLINAQEKERKLIAGEVHDSIGSSLGAIKFRVEQVLQKGDIADTNDILPMIQQAIEESRRIQMALRPPSLDDLGILPTLNWFCREFQKTYSGIQVKAQLNIEENEVPDEVKTVIYRICQEAFNNIVKHSKAKAATLSLRKRNPDKIELVIEDNGRGFNLQEKLSLEDFSTGLGLTSMRERAELSGGVFVIESNQGTGTTIRISWPLLLI
ncbi:MAG TPA: ATP-binding protein [Thermodesulfobacteriota bacterium]|jgi:PAS domain S-box-containing protein|nr:ATP-binding protein [Thermodesulfobacteriota bacterium]